MSEEQRSRKELIAEYKEQKQPMGVYQIRNLVNGKILVASTPNLRAAWNAEQFKLELGAHLNESLQRDWREYGEKQFVFEVLHELKLADEVTDFRGELKALETLVIEDLQPYGDRGYNRKPTVR
ncbi:MAG: GIY-YIG nuclease family protein [Bacteroidetes bacterium]|nr:GIY-YIG nuclease family protein [Bacteroidota bacterium]